LSSSSQTQRRQNTKKNNNKKKPIERRELTLKLLFCALIFGSYFYPSVSNPFSWHFLLQVKEKKKKQIKKKP
jgi:hypothetical protein